MKRSVSCAVSLVLLSSLAAQAQAQDETKPEAAASASKNSDSKNSTKPKAERIEVTGSRIKQIDVETASPVTTFTKEEIQKSGQATVSDFIRTKFATGSMTSENQTLSQSSGSVTFGGRAVEAQYTLILVNGRRLPVNAVESDSTDLNLIPLAAVERIDYVTDGASAIYGSDAVAGVINIITKKSYDGFSVFGKVGQSSRKDALETSAQVVSGVSGDKGNFLIAADLFKREPAMMHKRDLGKSGIAPNGKDGRSPRGLPGSIARADGTLEYAPDCAEADRLEGFCLYDFAKLYEAIPRSERQSIYTIFDRQLTDTISIFGEARFSNSYVLTANGASPGGVDLSATAPANPYQGEEVTYYRRFLDFGPRVSDNTNQSFSLVLGLRGSWNDIDWEFASTKHRLQNEQIGKAGYVHAPTASKYFNDGTLDPTKWNVFDTPEKIAARDAIDTNTFRIGNSTLETYSFGITTPLPFTLPGGAPGIATGVEYRKDTFNDQSDKASEDGEILGNAGGSGAGEQETKSAYVEVSAPVVKEVNVKVAARHDYISKENSATTANGGVTYKPIPMLLLRATYGTGFKAPQLHDRFLAKSFGVNQAKDPYACANFGQCTSREINTESGGNPDLKPEKSTYLNVGTVVEPVTDLTLKLDYWALKIKDKIGSLGIQEILNDEATYGKYIQRVGGRLNTEGSKVITTLQNLTKEESSGLDFVTNYSLKLGEDRVTTTLMINKMLTQKSQSSDVQPLCDLAKENNGVDGSLSGEFASKFYSVGGSVRYEGGFDSYDGGRDSAARTCDWVDPSTKYTVKPHTELDLNLTLYATFGTQVGFGIQNVTDEKPAFDPNYINGWPYYDQGRYSNIGRFYYMTLAHEFH